MHNGKKYNQNDNSIVTRNFLITKIILRFSSVYILYQNEFSQVNE